MKARFRQLKPNAEAPIEVSAQGKFLLGKHPDCAVRFAYAAGKQLEFVWKSGGLWVRTPNVFHVSRLNGQVVPADADVQVRSGDQISFGDTEIEVELA